MNALRERLQYRVHRGHRKADRRSVVIAPLADGKRDWKPVARRRERAGRVGSVGARWIFKAIEIEHEFAGLVEAVGRKAGIEKTAGAVSGGGAGCVAKNEEKFCDRGIFEDGLKPKCFSRKSEFRGAGNGLIVAGADESGEGDGFTRGKGNPFGSDAIDGVRRVPMETVKAGDGGRMRILDAKSEARLAADHVDVESADGEMRGNFIVVRFGSQGLRFCGSPSDEEVGRESSRGRIQRDGFPFEVEGGEMWRSGSEMDLAVRGGAERVVSRPEPFEADEGEPAVRLQKFCGMLRAPGSGVFLPRGVLWEGRERKDCAASEK